MTKTGIFLVSFFIIIVSCEKDINWEVNESQTRLIAEGMITDEYKQHSIALTKSHSYYNSDIPEPVCEAEVTISVDDTVYRFIEINVFPGLYMSQVPFSGVAGKSYYLSIKLKNEIFGNKEYTAFSVLKQPFNLDSINIFFYENPSDGLFNYESKMYFTIFGKEPETTGDYYILKVYKNNTLFTERITDLQLIDDRWCNGLNIIKTADFGFFQPVSQNDTLLLEILSIENEYYNYLNQIKQELGAKDPFGFLAPPSNIQGNISNGAMGYFYTTSSRKSFIILE